MKLKWKLSKLKKNHYQNLYESKNTLTGLVNCKKITRHHAHLSLCVKSWKTNDAKSRKWPTTSTWAIFEQISKGFNEYLQINNFFQKSGSVTFLSLQSPNLKIRKIFRAIFEKTALRTNQPTNQISKCLILGSFGNIFANISKSITFFQKSSFVIFLPFIVP